MLLACYTLSGTKQNLQNSYKYKYCCVLMMMTFNNNDNDQLLSMKEEKKRFSANICIDSTGKTRRVRYKYCSL